MGKPPRERGGPLPGREKKVPGMVVPAQGGGDYDKAGKAMHRDIRSFLLPETGRIVLGKESRYRSKRKMFVAEDKARVKGSMFLGREYITHQEGNAELRPRALGRNRKLSDHRKKNLPPRSEDDVDRKCPRRLEWFPLPREGENLVGTGSFLITATVMKMKKALEEVYCRMWECKREKFSHPLSNKKGGTSVPLENGTQRSKRANRRKSCAMQGGKTCEKRKGRGIAHTQKVALGAEKRKSRNDDLSENKKKGKKP